jgi:hypothetical protein
MPVVIGATSQALPNPSDMLRQNVLIDPREPRARSRSRRLRLVAALCSSTFLAPALHAQPQWGNLPDGRYAVGYRTIRAIDPDRRYAEAPRSVQVFVWYPAVRQAGADFMPYEGYFDDASFDWGGDSSAVRYLSDQLRRGFQSGSLNPSFPGRLSDEQFAAILRTPTRVLRDATPAPGRFPVILHAHSNGVLHQSVMLEYLASQGYVVMSVSMYNSAPAFYGRGDATPDALLNLAEDFSLMLGLARSMENAEASRAAAVGMLAQAGLAMQMKAAPLAAVACIECLGYGESLQKLPFYDPRVVRIPILELINSRHEDETTGQGKTFIDLFRSSTRYIGRSTDLAHSDFYPFPKIANPGTAHAKHDAIVEMTHRFLDATLKGDSSALRLVRAAGPLRGVPEGFLRIREEKPAGIPPTEGEFLGWLRYGEMERARAAWTTFGASLATRGRMFFVVLFLARDGEGHAAEAVAMFRSGFPAAPGTMEARQDAMLTQLLARAGRAP